MTIPKKIPLRNSKDIPQEMTQDEAREFWQAHEITEEYLEQAGVIPEEELPPIRSRKSFNTSIRLDEDLTRRLKILATRKGKGYQTLLKEFVLERLYEEEKREKILE
jgi:predicted DNA binding CopG/RHH family protein